MGLAVEQDVLYSGGETFYGDGDGDGDYDGDGDGDSCVHMMMIINAHGTCP